MGDQKEPGQETGGRRTTNTRCAAWLRGCPGASWGTPSNGCDSPKHNAEHVAANGAARKDLILVRWWMDFFAFYGWFKRATIKRESTPLEHHILER